MPQTRACCGQLPHLAATLHQTAHRQPPIIRPEKGEVLRNNQLQGQTISKCFFLPSSMMVSGKRQLSATKRREACECWPFRPFHSFFVQVLPFFLKQGMYRPSKARLSSGIIHPSTLLGYASPLSLHHVLRHLLFNCDIELAGVHRHCAFGWMNDKKQ